MAGFCEYGNKPTGPTKCAEILWSVESLLAMDDAGSKFPWNDGLCLPDRTAQRPRKHQSSQSSPREPEISGLYLLSVPKALISFTDFVTTSKQLFSIWQRSFVDSYCEFWITNFVFYLPWNTAYLQFHNFTFRSIMQRCVLVDVTQT